jgi:hypothetical protein
MRFASYSVKHHRIHQFFLQYFLVFRTWQLRMSSCNPIIGPNSIDSQNAPLGNINLLPISSPDTASTHSNSDQLQITDSEPMKVIATEQSGATYTCLEAAFPAAFPLTVHLTCLWSCDDPELELYDATITTGSGLRASHDAGGFISESARPLKLAPSAHPSLPDATTSGGAQTGGTPAAPVPGWAPLDSTLRMYIRSKPRHDNHDSDSVPD